MSVKCNAIAKSGSRCSRPALAGSQWCLMHDPASAEVRREAARKGGHARSNKARAAAQVPDAMTPADLAGYLSLMLKKTMVGSLEPKVATAIATLARALLEAQQAAAQPSITELQEQMDALRVMVERQGRVA